MKKVEIKIITYVMLVPNSGQLQGVNSEMNIQKGDEFYIESDGEKSINQIQQTQYNGCLKENSNTRIVRLCEFQCEVSEKLIFIPKELRCDMEQMEQMFTPVDIPALTCYQTVPNNVAAKQIYDEVGVKLYRSFLTLAIN